MLTSEFPYSFNLNVNHILSEILPFTIGIQFEIVSENMFGSKSITQYVGIIGR